MNLWDVIGGGMGMFFDMLRSFAAGIVGRVLLTLGIGFASYTLLLPELVAFVNQYLNGLPPGVVELIAALRLDQGLTLIFSALGVKMGTKINPIRVGGQDAAP